MRTRGLSDALGVEVLDLDLSTPQAEEVRNEVVAAWREHQLVLLRQQDLTADQQVAFAEWFGPIRPPDALVHPELGAGATHSHLSNTRPDGTGGTADVMRH